MLRIVSPQIFRYFSSHKGGKQTSNLLLSVPKGYYNKFAKEKKALFFFSASFLKIIVKGEF